MTKSSIANSTTPACKILVKFAMRSPWKRSILNQDKQELTQVARVEQVRKDKNEGELGRTPGKRSFR